MTKKMKFSIDKLSKKEIMLLKIQNKCPHYNICKDKHLCEKSELFEECHRNTSHVCDCNQRQKADIFDFRKEKEQLEKR